MKTILQLAFLLFYAASSYSATQERTSLIVQEWEHTASRDDRIQIEESCPGLQDSFPKYRQAKPRSGIDLDSLHTRNFQVLPQLTVRPLVLLAVSFKPNCGLRNAQARAPPIQL